jgi:hypothetical protein
LIPHWLRKPARFIQGTWDDPEDAARWLEPLLRELWSPEDIGTKRGCTIEESLESCRTNLRHGRDYMATGPVGYDYAEFYILTCPNGGGTAPCPAGRTDARPPGRYQITGVP